MNPGQLNTENIPPFRVPAPFFLSVPLFGLLAGFLLLIGGEFTLTSRWLSETIAATHLLTLGVLGMAMIGALFQVLPVIAGTPVPGAARIAGPVWLALFTGIVLMIAGLLGLPGGSIALPLLCGGLLGVLLPTLWATRALPADNHSGRTLRLALWGLLVTAALGLWLLAGRLGLTAIDPGWGNLHPLWALGGWVGLLLMGVAWQVVPMFQVTPAYPDWLTRHFGMALFTLLLFGSALQLLAPDWLVLAVLPLALLFAVFAVVTLKLQGQRKRKVADVTVDFWRLAMYSLLLGVAGLLAGLLPMELDSRYAISIGGLLLIGFAVSAVNGMLYKILPFLAWLHLQKRLIAARLIGKHRVPNMKQFIDPELARKQFWLHFGASGLIIVAPWLGYFTQRLTGAALVVSFGLLGINLISCVRTYRQHHIAISAAASAATDAP